MRFNKESFKIFFYSLSIKNLLMNKQNPTPFERILIFMIAFGRLNDKSLCLGLKKFMKGDVNYEFNGSD